MNNDINDINSSGRNEEGKNDLLRDLNDDLDSGHEFDRDATEGLQELHHAEVPVIVHKLNKELNYTLSKKKKRRNLPDQSAFYIIVIIILLLITVAYIILRKSLQ